MQLVGQACSAPYPAAALSPGAETACTAALPGLWPHVSGDSASAQAGWPAQPGRVQLTAMDGLGEVGETLAQQGWVGGSMKQKLPGARDRQVRR